MRGPRIPLATLCCVAALAGCSGSRGGSPAGVSITRQANYSGTLSDMASTVTADTVLRHKGAKLLKTEPFPDCPGEAGLQSYRLQSGKSNAVLVVAFTQWNGTAVTAQYERRADSPADPQAMQALRQAVCSA